MRRIVLAVLILSVVALGSTAARAQVTYSVLPTDRYYDGFDGTLFNKVALPVGATQVLFRVTGEIQTAGTGSSQNSPDGLNSAGNPSFNFTNTGAGGTYQGTHIGASTGIDPALFGVFFSPSFVGTPANSLNYRTDSGINPDPRTLSSYSPSVNQPFQIGDGYNQNNPFVTASDSNIPPGVQQVFNIPVGATFLLLGMGADPVLGDNFGGYTVHATYLPLASVPEPSTLLSAGVCVVLGLGYRLLRRPLHTR
jgi:hypothetical protein